MGDRYILTVKCPKCGHVDDDVYYAPTCGFTEHKCQCGHAVDLEKLTGISYEEASNRTEIERLCREAAAAGGEECCRDSEARPRTTTGVLEMKPDELIMVLRQTKEENERTIEKLNALLTEATDHGREVEAKYRDLQKQAEQINYDMYALSSQYHFKRVLKIESERRHWRRAFWGAFASWAVTTFLFFLI